MSFLISTAADYHINISVVDILVNRSIAHGIIDVMSEVITKFMPDM